MTAAAETEPETEISPVEQARAVLRMEADGILGVMARLDGGFTRLVDLIAAARGRVVVAGIGKSGLIGRKLVATFNSTGTRSIFLHPVEALHGDLGIVSPDDVVLALSNSGETEEVTRLVPVLKRIGCTVAAFTGHTGSTLARASDLVIDVGVEREACPHNLAPTTSTTALLAVGDALAVALVNRNHFSPSDFKRFHPGGALGQRLSREVADLMVADGIPLVPETAGMDAALAAMDEAGLGVVLISDADGALGGLITDGDIRRLVARRRPVHELSPAEAMTRNPKTVRPDTPAYDALNLMEVFQITVLPVTGPDRRVRGIVHLHDILGKGKFKFDAA
jgi:arabinose-5-phosphate isomerase